MATKVLKEKNVRDIFVNKQLTTDAIESLDYWINDILESINTRTKHLKRIQGVDIDLLMSNELVSMANNLVNHENFIATKDLLEEKSQ